MYKIKYTEQALDDAARLDRSEPKAYQKLQKLMEELRQHPTTGTGHPHQLSGDRAGQWSRSITKKHRLVYQINDTEILVLVLSAYGHYDDK
ncbi:MAG: Txe/YoeB family addiction module toxin [Odoribacter sp.]|nr:Txe/YoeB family addiction module toxin [Odoribacter sp.]